jgi:hypothetical protein
VGRSDTLDILQHPRSCEIEIAYAFDPRLSDGAGSSNSNVDALVDVFGNRVVRYWEVVSGRDEGWGKGKGGRCGGLEGRGCC